MLSEERLRKSSMTLLVLTVFKWACISKNCVYHPSDMTFFFCLLLLRSIIKEKECTMLSRICWKLPITYYRIFFIPLCLSGRPIKFWITTMASIQNTCKYFKVKRITDFVETYQILLTIFLSCKLLQVASLGIPQKSSDWPRKSNDWPR